MTQFRPTLADVAVRAGVSRTTVSNAYNRPDQLSEDRRRLVLAAAAELGYAGPDPLARSLRTRSADVVGLIFSARLSQAFSDPAAVEFLQGVAEVCEGRNRSLLLIPAGPEALNTAMVRRAAVDGFLVYSMPAGDPHIEAVLNRPEHVVVIDSPLDVPGTDFVGIDDRGAFAVIAAHVQALGHQRVAVVTAHRGEAGLSTLSQWLGSRPDGSAVFTGRMEGLADALTTAAHPVDSHDRVVVYAGTLNTAEVGRAGAAALLSAGQPPTAILCTSDALAFGVLAELADRGIDVPGQMTVTGFDDVPMAEQAGLTTMAQPTRAKGRLAAQLLLDRAGIEGSEHELREHVMLPTSLVVRATSGSPPAPSRAEPTSA